MVSETLNLMEAPPVATRRSVKPLEGSSDLAPADVLMLTRQALAQLRESVVITDTVLDEPGPHIVYVNAAFTRMTGWRADEVVGKSPRFLQGPKTTRVTLNRLRSNLESGEAFVGEDINYRKDGSEFYIDWYIEPLRDAAGEIIYYVAVQRDVTERKVLEQQLLHAQRLEGIGLLASGIAHDLNNIFAPIQIAPQLLRHSITNPKDQELLSLVEKSARRGVDLVKQILVFAREDKCAPAKVQPLLVLEEVAQMAGHTFPKSIQVAVDAAPETWLVEVDATQIYQLILNLCVNARDAIDGVGTVAIAARNILAEEPLELSHGRLSAGRYVLLSVADTGSGIPATHLEKIFQPFFTSKAAGKGTGLGLSTVAIVVKNARGGLDVQTEIGRGTTFSVYLPAAEGGADDLPSSATIPRARAARSILIVDHEKVITSVMREVLTGAGHAVVTARSHSAAQLLLSQNTFDLALVDLALPGEPCGATARALRALGLSVITMADQVTNDSKSESPATSATLQKPFTFSELLAAVDQVVPAHAEAR